MKANIQLSTTAYAAVRKLARHKSLSHEIIKLYLERIPHHERLSFVMTLTERGKEVLRDIYPTFLNVLLN